MTIPKPEKIVLSKIESCEAQVRKKKEDWEPKEDRTHDEYWIEHVEETQKHVEEFYLENQY